MLYKLIPIVLLSFLSLTLEAQVKHSPASFIVNGKKAVFVDFKEASYDIVFDSSEKIAKSIAIFQFETNEEGMPIFDLVESPTAIFIDGKQVSQKLINSPDGDTQFRVAEESISPGNHTLKVESAIYREVDFESDYVSVGFWYSDFKDRSFMEAYLPTNLEYDQYKMTFNIDFKSFKNQKIFSNGKITKLGDAKFKVEFPPTYTASSVYFHTDKVGKNIELPFELHSINGRTIPVMLYSLNPESDLKATKEKITDILKNLEKKFGPFPHPALTVLDSGKREMAMEYSGALTFDPWTLQHELTHSYFARGGLMPANGNAGWIDEAISYWNDKDSPSLKDLGDLKTNLAGHSQYRRFTDHKAPADGSKFMSYLHFKFQSKGGLVPFLNQLVKEEAWKPMTTNEFKDKMSKFYGEDLTDLFNRHLYSN